MHVHRLAFTLLAALLLLPGVILTGCARQHTSSGNYEKAPPTPARPVVDTRVIAAEGTVLTFPADAVPAALASERTLSATEAQALETNPQAQQVMRPRMLVSAGDTGRFVINRDGNRPFYLLEVTPSVQGDGQIAMGIKISATGENGMIDTLERDRLVRPGTGQFEVFGPLRYDSRQLYTLLKVELRAE